jgi:hypothetical protein
MTNSALLDIAKLQANPNARVTIVHPGNTKTTIGLVEGDFGFGMSSNFSSEDQVGANPLTAGYNAIANTIGAGTQSVIANVRQTVSQWTGSVRPTFQIPLTVVQYDTSVKPLDMAKDFFSGVAFEYGAGGILQAPNGYKVTKLDSNFGADSFAGTWTIQMGKWFRATTLVLVDVQAQFSKEIVRSSGQPLWATFNLSFTPAKLPDQKEVASWFLL